MNFCVRNSARSLDLTETETETVDILSPPPGISIPDFTQRRTSLKVKNGGLGFRPLASRFLALNSLNNTLALAIDHKDEKNVVTKGYGTRCRVYLVRVLSTSRNRTNVGLFFTPLELLSETTTRLLSHASKAAMLQL